MANNDRPKKRWDAFISHASEDKKSFVRPLASALTSLGASIWYDEFTLKPGASLSQSIDKGLAQSRYGIVVLSRSFMSKPWPKRELAGLVAREVDGHNAIIPVWHEVGRDDVSNFSPTLADKLAIRTSDANAIDIALQVLAVIRHDLYERHPRAHLMKLANGEAIAELQETLVDLREQLAEFQCPYCQSRLVQSIDAPADEEQKYWDLRRIFECGYCEFGGTKEELCPKDPEFPKFSDYELSFREDERDTSFTRWTCVAHPKTKAARLVSLWQTSGPTKEKAMAEMTDRFKQRASH